MSGHEETPRASFGAILKHLYAQTGADVGPLTLTDFLLARIAEDEAAAREATAGPWEYQVAPNPQDTGYYHGVVMARPLYMQDFDASSYEPVAEGYTTQPTGPGSVGAEFDPSLLDPKNGGHIARHDPARVLAECEAKLQIVERYLDVKAHVDRGNYDDEYASELLGLEVALEFLTLPYADHEDCREEWRP